MAKRLSQSVFSAAFFFVAALPIAAIAGDDNGLTSKIVAPDEVISGRTYGNWSATCWQWALSIPASSHPLLDKGKCTTGQTGKVFFLGGSFGSSTLKRQCTVPSGKNLFFPIVNSTDFAATPPDTINSFRADVQNIIDGAIGLEVDLDGLSLKDLKGFRIQSIVFDVTFPAGNLAGVKAGNYFIAVDDGVYVMLKPLSPGPHLLHFHGSITPLTLDITYQLTVSS